nr:putative reverse transcriptase, RNA-dependent DNA polymerase, Gag-polypeptide of LTR copia-type [Tanacetum cinerariifolium]
MTALDPTTPTLLSDKLSLVTHHHLLTRYDVDKYTHGSNNETGSSTPTPLTPEELKVDKIVLSWIFTTLPDTLQARLVVARSKSAKEAWGLISDIIKDNKMSRTNALEAELRSLKLGDQSMESYFRKIESIVNILTSLDFHVNDEDVVHYDLEGMRLKSKSLALPMDSSSSSPMVLMTESGTNRRSSNTTQVKTWRPCFNLAKGACWFGDSCRYVHDANARTGNNNNGSNTRGRGTFDNSNTTNELLTKLFRMLMLDSNTDLKTQKNLSFSMAGDDVNENQTGDGGTKTQNERVMIDHNSPFYLYASDYPKQMHVNDVLTDKNYIDWEQEMMNFMFAKNKTGFIDGSIKKPEKISDKYLPWMHGTTVSAYYTRLRVFWDGMESILPTPRCTCDGCECGLGKKLTELKGKERTYEFLMGLDDQFSVIKTQILAMKPTPDLSAAYHLVAKDEQQRTIVSSKGPVREVAAFHTSFQGRREQTRNQQEKGWTKNKSGFQANKTEKCSECRREGHNKSGCFKIIGYPVWWQGKGKRGQVEAKNSDGGDETVFYTGHDRGAICNVSEIVW